MNLLDTNAVDIDQAPFEPFDYNETEGGVDDHGCEEELEEIEAEAYEQSQTKKEKSQRSKNYTILKDQALIQAWSAVSLDACTDTSQTAKRYWQRIEDQYFRMMAKYPYRTPRTFWSLQGRWKVIKPMCSRWAACLEQVRNAPPSGTVESDYVSLFCLCSICASSYCIMRNDWITLFTLCRTRLLNIDTRTWKLRKAKFSN